MCTQVVLGQKIATNNPVYAMDMSYAPNNEPFFLADVWHYFSMGTYT